MEFRVLGPLEVRADEGEPVGLGGARPRAVLARLLIARGVVVSTDALIHDLYGDTPPPSALSSLHSYVSNLRRAIEPDRGPWAKPKVLIGRPPGYLLAAEDVDASRFEELVGRSEFQSPGEALTCLDAAFGLWRGTPYGEFGDETWALTEVSRLRELRLVALERRARALLDLGRPQAVITDLEAETAGNPLRERLWCLLALSLYRTGRQAEALAVLRRAARLLADQLGLDPGPELRSLEQDILRQADSLEPAAGPATLAVPPQPRPVTRDRDDRLAELMALPERAARTGLRLAVVSGEAGIGKTFLLEEFGEHCSARLGQLVLWGRCHDAEGLPPLWPWVQVLRTLEQHCPPGDRRSLAGLLDADRPADAHRQADMHRQADVDRPADRHRRADTHRPADARAVARWLAAAARVRPLVIVLDDLQRADPASLDLLRDLVMRLDGAAVTLVAAFRPGFDDPLSRLARYDLVRLRVRGLAPEAVRSMAAGMGVELDAEAAARLTDRTGGNPFFVRECLRLRTGGHAVDAVPESVAGLVRSQLEAEVAEVLAVAAVLGREFDPAIVAQVTGPEAADLLDRAVRAGLLVPCTDPDLPARPEPPVPSTPHDLTAAADPSIPGTAHGRAADAGLSVSGDAYGLTTGGGLSSAQDASDRAPRTGLPLSGDAHGRAAGAGLPGVAERAFSVEPAGGGRLVFVHDLVREALAGGLPPRRRAAVHRDLATALATRPSADVAAIACHAVQAGSHDEAVRWAVAAAEQAGLRLAYAEAARWWGHAVAAHDASGGDPAQHVELLLHHVQALEVAGDREAARRAGAAALRAADRADAGAGLVVRALTALGTPSLSLLRDPYQTSRHQMDRHPADDPRPLTRARARARGDRRVAVPRPRVLTGLTELTGELHDLAEHTDNPQVELLAGMVDACGRLEAFDVAGADWAAARCDALLELHPLPWPRFQHTLWHANRLTLDGRFDEADRLYDDADGQARHLNLWHARQTVAAGRVALSYHRGAIADAAPLIAAVRGVHPTLHHDATTLHLCAQGHLDHARRLNGGPRPAPPRDWSWLSATCLRAAAVAALGRTHECRTAYTALLPYSGRISALSAVLCLGPVDWHLALLATATGHHDAATAHLTALEQQADAAGLHWWRDRAAATGVRQPLQVATRA
ncbi:BTAD domain-containing putative transcriptional regulator [Nonomuraea angiospora]|uniref:BTAD domain-containing putative transcriptional regulator n=1 Tax=Nonomuraea angiospora TaxID=46172 RepID=UPI0029BAE1CD|nr:BTAD domain-containing putative transcriptional regulator [Nonomuraea angiospora]MDX3101297.1 BTAD domain-containing putative transcriptional regulator [Nonomuraea angiospora]